MREKDLEIRRTIESILENDFPGQGLKNYFAGLPDKKIRKAISILSGMYPDKTTVSDDEFSFILYMFSDMKFMKEESFSAFVFAINILNFTERQKGFLRNVVTNNIEILCDKGNFELNPLLVSLFEPNELLQYLDELTRKGTRAVLHHVYHLLLYENLGGSDEKIEDLKHKSRPELWVLQPSVKVR